MENKKVNEFNLSVINQVQKGLEKAIKNQNAMMINALTGLLKTIDLTSVVEPGKRASDIAGRYLVHREHEAYIIEIREEGLPVLHISNSDSNRENGPFQASKIKTKTRQ